MRKLWFAVAASVIVATGAYLIHSAIQGVPDASAQTGIAWMDGSFDQVLARARDEQKPVMLDFYATWCSPCKKLERETFQDPDVTSFTSEQLVCARRNAERDDGLELARRFMVLNYPTVILLNPDGTEIDRHVGYLPPTDYLALLQNYLAGINTLDDYQRRVAESPDDAELHLELGTKLSHRLMGDEAEYHLQRVTELDPANESGLAVEALMMLGDLHRRLATREDSPVEWELAVGYTRRAMEEYPSEETLKHGLKRIAYYQKHAGNLDAAAEAHRELLALDPDNPKLLNAFAWFCAKEGVALDEATEKALLAVKLSDGDPAIVDTLAEVYYARGMYDEAIATIQEAIAKDDDAYFREQLDKFEKARDTGTTL
jgi:thioredoxin-like negative regulator of GroEL